MTAAGPEKVERRGNLEIRHYDRSKIWYNLVSCPLCEHDFAENEPRWNHFLDEHGPADAGLSPIGERAGSRSLFDATFKDTGRTLEEWGTVLNVIIEESGHNATINVDDGELAVSIAEGVAGWACVTLVDRIKTAGFNLAGLPSTETLRVSRPEFGLQSPYRETMGPTGEHALATDGGQPRARWMAEGRLQGRVCSCPSCVADNGGLDCCAPCRFHDCMADDAHCEAAQ